MNAMNTVSIRKNKCAITVLGMKHIQRDTKRGCVVYFCLCSRVMQSLFMKEMARRCIVDTQNGARRSREGVYT